jgi:hypothetical protein
MSVSLSSHIIKKNFDKMKDNKMLVSIENVLYYIFNLDFSNISMPFGRSYRANIHGAALKSFTFNEV